MRFVIVGSSAGGAIQVVSTRHVTTMSTIYARSSGGAQLMYIDAARVHIPPALRARALPALLQLRSDDNDVVQRCDGWNSDVWRAMLTVTPTSTTSP